jgi:peptide/nickel transport system substrate-binding protein
MDRIAQLFGVFAALTLVVLVWTDGSLAQRVSAPRGEIRIVDKSPPNWSYITLNIFEHLVELDQDGKLVARLATGWQWIDDRTLQMKLRQNVKFQNGEKFDAEIVKLNWEENTKRRQPHIIGQYMNFKPGSKLEIVDPQTVRFVFPEPDGGALVKLAAMHIANRQFYREVGWGDEHW